MPSAQRSLMGSPLYSGDRKSTRLNSSHLVISYAVFCLKKKKYHTVHRNSRPGRKSPRAVASVYTIGNTGQVSIGLNRASTHVASPCTTRRHQMLYLAGA